MHISNNFLLLIFCTCTCTHTHLFCSQLESSHYTVLDLIEVLCTLGEVNYHVGPHALGTKAPDLAAFWHLPVVLLCKKTSSDLGFLCVCHFSLQNWSHQKRTRQMKIRLWREDTKYGTWLAAYSATYTVNGFRQSLRERSSLHEDPVVFVGRFG